VSIRRHLLTLRLSGQLNMPTAPQIDAPVSLGSFFPPDSDEEEETELDQCFETQDVTLADKTLQVRQFAYHSHNANRVWPGTFNLTDHLFERDDDGKLKHKWGSILELGTATGLLAIRLAMSSSLHSTEEADDVICSSIVTSDYEDDEVESHVRHNFEINGFEAEKIPIHVPHTWGTGWMGCASKKGIGEQTFDTIVASDILLYVSAYPALVETLLELMNSPQSKLVMSWNRRMKESSEFFDRMKDAGFECVHIGKCVYVFTLKSK
jgi:hypothetical protein